MNKKAVSKYLSFSRTLGQFLVCEFGALLISCFLIIATAIPTIHISGYFYYAEHPERREFNSASDGLAIAIGGFIDSLWLSLSLAVLAHVFVFKKFFIKVPLKVSSFFNKLAMFFICEISVFYIIAHILPLKWWLWDFFSLPFFISLVITIVFMILFYFFKTFPVKSETKYE